MNRDDSLWKSILENSFADFIRFFLADAEKIFDMDREVLFLNKELMRLSPAYGAQLPKMVDKLAKVYTREGKEEYILIHVEIQGYGDNDFEKRMFTYFYRIMDKYGNPVTAIAILTDTNNQFRPAVYRYKCFATSLTYRFQTYKISDQEEAALINNDNPFSIVILTVLLALKQKKKKLHDREILKLKIELAKNLISRNLPPKKMEYLMDFLQYYVHFKNKRYNERFESAIAQLTKKQEAMPQKIMSVRESLLDWAKKQGIERGKRIGRKEGKIEGKVEGKVEGKIEEKSALIKNLLQITDFPIGKIAMLTNAPEQLVLELKEAMA